MAATSRSNPCAIENNEAFAAIALAVAMIARPVRREAPPPLAP